MAESVKAGPPKQPKAQMRTSFAKSRPGTGFASNESTSPLQLKSNEKLGDTFSHQAHSINSTIAGMRATQPVSRAVMEKSGFWSDPISIGSHNQTKELAPPVKVDPKVYKRMKLRNPIEAENEGSGPRWGSTSAAAAFVKHPSSHQRYWQTDISLIGKKESDGYARQHLTTPNKYIDAPMSETHRAFTTTSQKRDNGIPSRTVIEQSGFSNSAIPIHNAARPLSDISVDDLHPIAVERMRHRSTTEYHNLFNPDPYLSEYQVSFQHPEQRTDRTIATAPSVRRGTTGFLHNTTIMAGVPGNSSLFKTGTTINQETFQDPQLGFRGKVQQTPNVVEHSGFWNH